MRSPFVRHLFVSGSLLLLAALPVMADDWPQWLGPQRDGVWRETGIIDKFPEKGPEIRWRTKIGAGYAGPAVVAGKVYVTDRVVDKGDPTKNPFGRDLVTGKERVLCLDAVTGKIIWTHEYEAKYEVSYASGPRTTPVVAGNRVWTLGTMGDLLCLNAEDGKVIWSKNVHQEYDNRVPGWGWAANPLLEGDKLICIVGGKSSVVVAFNKDTGKEIWKALSAAEPGYCPPMIYKVGNTRQLIIWHPESINSLDPDTGKVFWTHKGLVGAGLTVPTPRLDGNRLFITSFYGGSIMLELNGTEAPKVAWQGKWWGTKERGKEQPKTSDGLHAIMPTPFIHEGYIYGICSYGELRCLKEDTGERVWMTLKATGSQEQPTERWGNAFLVAQGDRYFLFNEKGDLIIAKLTPKGYEEISRAHILDPDNRLAGRPVVWSHPAFADKCMFVRNDHEIVCVPLGK